MSATETAHPPTIIVVHPKERRSKCSVQHLRGREGFVFWNYPKRDPVGPAVADATGHSAPNPEPRQAQPDLRDYVRLGFGGPVIAPADADRGLLILDGTWRWAESMEPDFADLPVRSLPDLQTAYPRVSKTYDDPPGGLATIEALYAAYRLMGRETGGLLEGYYWGGEFLKRNGESLL